MGVTLPSNATRALRTSKRPSLSRVWYSPLARSVPLIFGNHSGKGFLFLTESAGVSAIAGSATQRQKASGSKGLKGILGGLIL